MGNAARGAIYQTINSPHLQQDLLARALSAQLLRAPREPRRHQDGRRRSRRRRQPRGRLLRHRAHDVSNASVKTRMAP